MDGVAIEGCVNVDRDIVGVGEEMLRVQRVEGVVVVSMGGTCTTDPGVIGGNGIAGGVVTGEGVPGP